MNELKENIEKDFMSNGFIKDNKISIEKIELNQATVTMPIEEKHLNPSKIVHGGIVYSLADTAMGLAARTNGKNVVTVNAQINYLRPAKTNSLKAEARCSKIGNHFAFYETDIFDENNTLLATCTGTFYFIDKKEF